MSTSATITSGEAAGIVNGNWITATLMSTEDQKGLWRNHHNA